MRKWVAFILALVVLLVPVGIIVFRMIYPGVQMVTNEIIGKMLFELLTVIAGGLLVYLGTEDKK